MKTCLSIVQDKIEKRWEQVSEEYIVTDFPKSGYVLQIFLPKLQDHVKEHYFIQEAATYRKQLQRIFRTVEFEDLKVLKKALF